LHGSYVVIVIYEVWYQVPIISCIDFVLFLFGVLCRSLQEADELERRAREQLEKCNLTELESNDQAQKKTEERRRRILLFIEQIQRREAIEGLKVRKCHSVIKKSNLIVIVLDVLLSLAS